MLRLAIAGLIVAMFIAADASGQCGCVDQSSKKVSVGSVAGWMCYVDEITALGGWSWYEVEDCSNSELETLWVLAESGIPLGNCESPSTPGCYPNTSPASWVIIHPGLNEQKQKEAKLLLRKMKGQINESLAMAFHYVLRETDFSHTVEPEELGFFDY